MCLFDGLNNTHMRQVIYDDYAVVATATGDDTINARLAHKANQFFFERIYEMKRIVRLSLNF